MLVSLLAVVSCIALSLAAPAVYERDTPFESLARRAATPPPLVLVVKTQDDVNDPDDLTVMCTVINTGKKTLKILNDPNGPLSTWKTHTFDFYEVSSPGMLKARSGGSIANVNAVLVKYNPSVAAALSDPSAYTILKPGENKTVTHDLSGMYTFRTAGAYAVRVNDHAEYFGIVKNDHSVEYVKAKIYDGTEAAKWMAVNVSETGTYPSLKGLVSAGIPNHSPARRWNDEPLAKRQAYVGCSLGQRAAIAAAITGANTYIAESNTYLGTMYYLANVRYRTWFGPYTKLRWDAIRAHFFALRNQPARFQYDCSCTSKDTFAYVYPNRFGTVYLCGAFWSAPNMGTDSKAGTIIHEATHFTQLVGTNDYVYGQSGAKALAMSNPAQAIMNADSHEYFAENTPRII